MIVVVCSGNKNYFYGYFRSLRNSRANHKGNVVCVAAYQRSITWNTFPLTTWLTDWLWEVIFCFIVTDYSLDRTHKAQTNTIWLLVIIVIYFPTGLEKLHLVVCRYDCHTCRFFWCFFVISFKIYLFKKIPPRIK